MEKMVFYISSVTMVTTFNCNCNLKENYTKEIKMALNDTDFAMKTLECLAENFDYITREV